jgi:hypothetical protein
MQALFVRFGLVRRFIGRQRMITFIESDLAHDREMGRAQDERGPVNLKPQFQIADAHSGWSMNGLRLCWNWS